MVDLSINTNLVRKGMSPCCRYKPANPRYSRAVINLSGGIDSAVSCVLATHALGAENVLAMRIP